MRVQASDINALFGFRLECIERMGDQQGLWAWQRINALFNWLPLAALIEDRIVCMHGGVLVPSSCWLCMSGVQERLYGRRSHRVKAPRSQQAQCSALHALRRSVTCVPSTLL